MMDTNALMAKAESGNLSLTDIKATIQALEHYQKLAVFLAEQQSETLASLPGDVGLIHRSRHIDLCKRAADGLEGSKSYGTLMHSESKVVEFCREAVKLGEKAYKRKKEST